MAKKPSIQKAILKILANKKAISLENIAEKVLHSSPPFQGGVPERRGGNPNTTTTPYPLLHKEGRQNSYAITRSIKNLVSDGLVEAFSSEHKQYFRLTPEGKHKLNNINLDNESSLVSTTWDGFWRIILLDLPEERKSEREALRYLLKKAGFVCIKNSVWVSMYPFEHLFTNIKKDLGLSTELMIMVTDKLDEETKEAFLKKMV